jgi:hypothetical protein
MSYKVIGYTYNNQVLFKYGDKYITIKPSLPKADLCFYLDANARQVDKYYRDDILNMAKEGGRWDYKYVGASGNIYDYDCSPGAYADKPLVGTWLKRET